MVSEQIKELKCLLLKIIKVKITVFTRQSEMVIGWSFAQIIVVAKCLSGTNGSSCYSSAFCIKYFWGGM